MFLVLFTYLESSSLMYLLRVKLNHGHGVKRRKLIMMEYDSSSFIISTTKNLIRDSSAIDICVKFSP